MKYDNTADNNYGTLVKFENNLMVARTDRFNKTYLWLIAIIPIFIFGKKLVSQTN